MTNRLTGYLGKAVSSGREIRALGALQPFVIITSTGAGFTWNGTTSETLGDLIALANKDNTGEVRIAINTAVGAANYFPLQGGDSLGLPGVALNDIYLYFTDNADKLHLAYMKE